MKNGDKPIAPLKGVGGALYVDDKMAASFIDSAKPLIGLTKREYFAAMAMQGLCANPKYFDGSQEGCMDILPDDAVRLADTLLSELEKTETT